MSLAHCYDSFLASLTVRPSLFDLSSKVYPGSIRDQIVRASLFVDRAAESGYFGSNKSRAARRVLVVGAGASGVTVILRLAGLSNKVEAILADTAPKILGVQAMSTHRFISPSVYDWPASHYREDTFGGILPDYREGSPSRLARDWQVAYHKAIRPNPHRHARAHILEGNGPPWRVRFQGPWDGAELSEPEDFHVLVCCRGFGKERTIGDFPSYGFWERDPYPHLTRKLPPGFTGPVAILGGGDGGIQDALRFIANGATCRDIMTALHPLLEANPQIARTIHSLRCEEENAQRQIAVHPQSAAALEESLHRKYQALIALIFATQPAIFAEFVDKFVEFSGVHLFYRAQTLGPCFGLNRFLAMLFDEHLRRHHEHRLLRPGFTAESVACIGHRPTDDDPSDCQGKDHQVNFLEPENQPFSCQIVIPRIGIDTKRDDWSYRGAQLHQCLPWHLTHWGPA
jgi:hypothetical protein